MRPVIHPNQSTAMEPIPAMKKTTSLILSPVTLLIVNKELTIVSAGLRSVTSTRKLSGLWPSIHKDDGGIAVVAVVEEVEVAEAEEGAAVVEEAEEEVAEAAAKEEAGVLVGAARKTASHKLVRPKRRK